MSKITSILINPNEEEQVSCLISTGSKATITTLEEVVEYLANDPEVHTYGYVKLRNNTKGTTHTYYLKVPSLIIKVIKDIPKIIISLFEQIATEEHDEDDEVLIGKSALVFSEEPLSEEVETIQLIESFFDMSLVRLNKKSLHSTSKRKLYE